MFFCLAVDTFEHFDFLVGLSSEGYQLAQAFPSDSKDHGDQNYKDPSLAPSYLRSTIVSWTQLVIAENLAFFPRSIMLFDLWEIE
jgi:hypothetical protein